MMAGIQSAEDEYSTLIFNRKLHRDILNAGGTTHPYEESPLPTPAYLHDYLADSARAQPPGGIKNH